MKNQDISKLVILKIVCCGALFLFLIGGVSLVAGMSTGHIALYVLGTLIILWAIYRLMTAALDKTRKE